MTNKSTRHEGCHKERAIDRYNGLPTPNSLIQVYAHRAGRGLYPEQTLPAYQMALRIGCDYVDMDVNMSRDDVLVVTHDLTLNPDLTRNARGQWISTRLPVRQLSLSQIQSYNVGMLKPGTEYASCFPDQRTLESARIPTLEECIQYVKKISGGAVGFQIEIKNDPGYPDLSASPKEYAEAIAEMLERYDVVDITEIQAFDWQCLLELEKRNPAIKTAFLSDHTTMAPGEKDTGLWTAGYTLQDYDNSLPKMIKALGGDCWEPYEMDLTLDQCREAHELGLKVVVWGWPEMEGTELNDDRIIELITWGVDGFITDRPDILRGLIAARGFNVPAGFYISEHADAIAHPAKA